MVIVYEYDETTKNWEQLGNVITSPSPGNSFQLGFAIDFEGDVLTVGTPGKDNRGQVDLYSYNGSNEQWLVESIQRDVGLFVCLLAYTFEKLVQHQTAQAACTSLSLQWLS